MTRRVEVTYSANCSGSVAVGFCNYFIFLYISGKSFNFLVSGVLDNLDNEIKWCPHPPCDVVNGTGTIFGPSHLELCSGPKSKRDSGSILYF